MAGQVKTIYSDAAKQNAVYPRTKVSAITDGSNASLQSLLNTKLATTVADNTYAPKASPALTGTPTAPTALYGTDTDQIASTAFVQEAIEALPDPMVFKGTIGSATAGSGTISVIPTTGVSVGDTWLIVDEARTLSAQYSATGNAVLLDIGDTISAVSTTPLWATSPAKDDIGVTSVAAGPGLTTGSDGSYGGSVTSSGTLRETYTTITLPTFSAAGSKSVTCAGVTTTSHPVLDVVVTNSSDKEAIYTAWSHIYKAESAGGSITFYSDAATSTALTISVKGF